MIINDIRLPKDFHTETFSGYKKVDVYKALFKCIDEYKIEETCFWTIELLLSCQAPILYEKCILYLSKYINVLNPKLPLVFVNRYSFWKNNKLNAKEAINNQSIRNHLIELVLYLALSNKTKYGALPKVSEADFKKEIILKKLKANQQTIINKYSQKNDPVEVNVLVNELWDRILNKKTQEALYFFNMLLVLDKKKNIVCHLRNSEFIPKKFHSDFTMYLWYIFINESFISHNRQTQSIVNNLFELSSYQYTKAKTAQLLIYVIKLLSFPNLDLNKPLCSARHSIIQATAKVNFIIANKKSFEILKKKEKIEFIETSTKPPTENKMNKKEQAMMSLDIF